MDLVAIEDAAYAPVRAMYATIGYPQFSEFIGESPLPWRLSTPACPRTAGCPPFGRQALWPATGSAHPVFSEVSFTIGGGEAVALIGANGTGKSTLLKCLLGFVVPTARNLSVFGRESAG